ncbi:eukaryotic peptide chain release factor subunit 1-3 [Spatholobus suberectus]|nr:eukaryotic peptide chain release factor subunit 1-3 [Spatholobus suberectus]
MKYFPLLVQERGVKIPAPVREVAAFAAAPPHPPCLSVVLHGMFDCESRCFAPKVLLSDMSYFLTCSPIFCTLAPQISAKFLTTTAPLLFTTYTQKGKNKSMFPKETQPRINEVCVEPVCLCSSPKF